MTGVLFPFHAALSIFFYVFLTLLCFYDNISIKFSLEFSRKTRRKFYWILLANNTF